MRTDVYVLNNGSARAYMTSYPNMYTTRKRDTRCEVNVRSDYTIVIDRGACVYDGVISDLAAGLQDCTGHDLRAGCETSRWRDVSAGMSKSGKGERAGTKALEEIASQGGHGDGTDSVRQHDLFGTVSIEHVVSA